MALIPSLVSFPMSPLLAHSTWPHRCPEVLQICHPCSLPSTFLLLFPLLEMVFPKIPHSLHSLLPSLHSNIPFSVRPSDYSVEIAAPSLHSLYCLLFFISLSLALSLSNTLPMFVCMYVCIFCLPPKYSSLRVGLAWASALGALL